MTKYSVLIFLTSSIVLKTVELKQKIDEDLGFELLATLIMGKVYPYYLMKFIVREIAFGQYDGDDFLDRNFDRWEKKFYRENTVPITLKAKKRISKWNFSAFGNFILKVIKEW